MNTELNIVNPHLQYGKVPLLPPSNNYYLHIAAEIDHSFLPFAIWSGRKKKMIIREAKKWCTALKKDKAIVSAVVFEAVVIPPGKGAFLQKRQSVHPARFDIAILIESAGKETIQQIMASEAYIVFKRLLDVSAHYTYTTPALNIKRMASVDHTRGGVFLFNYFYGDDLQQNIDVWEYTAGWFRKETGLDNSTVLLPLHTDESMYTIINHCRWNSLSDILPSLLFKKTFHDFVLKNFYANNVAPMPILFRMA